MKKIIQLILLAVFGIAVGIAASYVAYYYTGDEIFVKVLGKRDDAQTLSISVDASNAELTAYAFEILTYIKESDYVALGQVVHPEYGVIFSPYATINLASNQHFTAAQIGDFPQDKNKYVWGKYDGNGEAIELTPSEYFTLFVFDKDFTQATEVGVDTIIRSGNSLENIKEIFPEIRFIDFHMPQADSEFEGLDWGSLRLGFEAYEGELKLTVILHSQWTI